MRLGKPPNGLKGRLELELLYSSHNAQNAHNAHDSQIRLEDLPAPLPVAKISPDELIEDILVATLRRVQNNSSPEVAAAAARYISLLTEKAL